MVCKVTYFCIFQQIDVMGRLVDELMARTHELLQPNPGLTEHITHHVSTFFVSLSLRKRIDVIFSALNVLPV